MQPESLVREPVSGRRLLRAPVLAVCSWRPSVFAWWQLLEKVWADSQTANSVQEGPLIIGYSPLVFLSAFSPSHPNGRLRASPATDPAIVG